MRQGLEMRSCIGEKRGRGKGARGSFVEGVVEVESRFVVGFVGTVGLSHHALSLSLSLSWFYSLSLHILL